MALGLRALRELLRGLVRCHHLFLRVCPAVALGKRGALPAAEARFWRPTDLSGPKSHQKTTKKRPKSYRYPSNSFKIPQNSFKQACILWISSGRGALLTGLALWTG